jgi:hypothetical protein
MVTNGESSVEDETEYTIYTEKSNMVRIKRSSHIIYTEKEKKACVSKAISACAAQLGNSTRQKDKGKSASERNYLTLRKRK